MTFKYQESLNARMKKLLNEEPAATMMGRIIGWLRKLSKFLKSAAGLGD